MPTLLHHHLKNITEHAAALSRPEAAELLQHILTEHPDPIQIAALLGALAARTETPAEIAGFVDTMRANATPLPLSAHERALLVDTCGTGGDNSGTFNISTAAALVAAAAAGATTAGEKIMVAKHGNRAVTSQSGSADVLEALGIPVDLTPTQAAGALRQHRFAFLHAPAHHPAMRAVMPIRKAIGVRTVFNILGPLTNPAGAPAQVIGVYSPRLVPLVAQAMVLLGTHHSMLVHGATTHKSSPNSTKGMDEISISGPTSIAEIKDGQITLHTLHPSDFNLQTAPIEELTGGNAQQNAAILRNIFAGHPGPPRDVVVLNAAAVLITANLAKDFPSAIHLAQATIDAGHVTQLINDLSTQS